MLFFTSGSERARKGIALSLQRVGGAQFAEGRAARTERDLRTSGGESTRFPTGKLIGIEVLVA